MPAYVVVDVTVTDPAQAQRWYDSEEYREPKAMRLKAGRANFVMVEGVA